MRCCQLLNCFLIFELCIFTVLSKMMRLEIFNERLARHWVRVDKVEYVIGNSILHWSCCTHDTWSIASLYCHSYWLGLNRSIAEFATWHFFITLGLLCVKNSVMQYFPLKNVLNVYHAEVKSWQYYQAWILLPPSWLYGIICSQSW